MKKVDISKFIEDAVRWRVLHQTSGKPAKLLPTFRRTSSKR